MAAGPIPWRAIRAWADEHGIADADGFDDLHAVVQHLDGIWLKDSADRLKKQSTNPKKR